MTRSVSTTVPSASRTPVTCPSLARMSSTRALKRTSTPWATSSWRIFSTAKGSRSEPMCGLPCDEDAVGRAEAGEDLQHLAHVRVVDARGELAVGVRAGAALAEVHVALEQERAVAHQLRHVLAALDDVLAALQHQRLDAPLRQAQRREHAGRPEAHDDRPLLRLPLHRRRRRQGGLRLAHVGWQRRGRPTGRQLHLERVDGAQARLLAGVEHAAHHAHLGDVGRRHAQLRRGARPQLALGLVEIQGDVVDSKGHGKRGLTRPLPARHLPGAPDRRCYRLYAPPPGIPVRVRSPVRTAPRQKSFKVPKRLECSSSGLWHGGCIDSPQPREAA